MADGNSKMYLNFVSIMIGTLLVHPVAFCLELNSIFLKYKGIWSVIKHARE